MDEIFNKAASYFPDLDQEVKRIGMDEFAVIHPDSKETILLTRHANVCAGLALVSENKDTAALVHLSSEGDFYRFGKEKVQEHVRRQWQVFAENLDRKSLFKAVAFGGRTISDPLLQEIKRRAPLNNEDRQKEIQYTHAFTVSEWVNETLHNILIQSKIASNIIDLRYYKAPHDAMVDVKSGEIIVVEYAQHLKINLLGNLHVWKAAEKLPRFGRSQSL